MSSATLRLSPSGSRSLAPAAWMGLAATIGLAVAVDVRLAAVLVGGLAAPLLVWSDPRAGFACLCAALGLNLDILSAPAHVSLPQVIALGVIASVALRAGSASSPTKALSPNRTARPKSGLWAFGGLLFVLAAAPSLVRPVDRGAAAVGLLQVAVVATILFALVRWIMGSRKAVDGLLAMLILGGLLSLGPALVQVVFGVGPEGYRVGGLMRAYSTYGQPNSYGLYLVGLAPLALALSVRDRIYLPACVAIVLGLALTGSRGAWVAALAGFGVLFLVTGRLRLSTVVTAVLGALFLAGSVALLPEAFIAGRFDLSDWSTQQRLLLLLTAVDGILRNPILGYGADSFGQMLPEMARTGLTDDVVMPHNMILHVWFELGLLAAVAFVALMAGYFTGAVRAYRRTRDLRLAGLMAGVAAMLTGSMFGSLFVRGIAETFVVLIGLSACLIVLPNQPTDRVG